MLKIFILWDLSLKISFLRFILFEVFLVITYFRFFLPWMYYFHDLFIWDFIFTTSSLIIHSFEFNFHRFCRNILDNIDIGMSMPVFINTWNLFTCFSLMFPLFTTILSNPQRLSCDDICGLDRNFVNKDNLKKKWRTNFVKVKDIRFSS